jgi:hypothetical protein
MFEKIRVTTTKKASISEGFHSVTDFFGYSIDIGCVFLEDIGF